ncbi:MAG: ABC transporter ATP-binding protein, partial [Polyangiaceae bacterium]|nr:ABC transporter ATP-binding protein [Polyangiaceae bacterium]
MTMTRPVLEVKNLEKTFRIGFFRKKVEAVRGVSFDVYAGEVFGLLGPNGAGKTTTIKSVLRLIFPDRGEIRVFGEPTSHRETMRRVGYMPENPYVYQYLRPLEFLDLCGSLMGMSAAHRRKRALELLEQLSLTHALDRPIGRFSKGMTQRVGIAQALLHEPELVVLDEPMSGLDPVGRKQMRDLLLEQKKAGRTLIFTSHILSDVEMLCDRVVIVNRGRVTASGKLDALLRPEVRRVEVELANVSAGLLEGLRDLPLRSFDAEGGRVRFSLE